MASLPRANFLLPSFNDNRDRSKKIEIGTAVYIWFSLSTPWQLLKSPFMPEFGRLGLMKLPAWISHVWVFTNQLWLVPATSPCDKSDSPWRVYTKGLVAGTCPTNSSHEAFWAKSQGLVPKIQTSLNSWDLLQGPWSMRSKNGQFTRLVPATDLLH